MSSDTVTLYRPTGPRELALLRDADWRRWPPRLPEQPIFYPVTNEEYATEIASKWNVAESGGGYVTRFHVHASFMREFDVQTVGASHHTEWWIPAERLEELNDHISGTIEVIAAFGRIRTVTGDLLDQDVDAIVNAWNRNIIPWWLLLPRGVSGAIKRAAGYAPFRELAKLGPIPAGGAVMTSAGRLKCKAIIHVAAVTMFWTSSEQTVRDCVRNALQLAKAQQFASIAMPLVGAGTGGLSPDRVQHLLIEEAARSDYAGEVVIVRFMSSRPSSAAIRRS